MYLRLAAFHSVGLGIIRPYLKISRINMVLTLSKTRLLRLESLSIMRKTVEEIVNINYNSKFEKAKSWVEIWSKRNLTLLGKVLIIKSLILSQFTYLVLPLPRPNYQIVNRLNTLIFHFLWGCKRDKMKRDIVTRSKEEGGLGLVYPYNFILILKLTLFNKLFDENCNHPWKSIVIRQLMYPDHLVVAVENGAARRNCNFTQDVLHCY